MKTIELPNNCRFIVDKDVEFPKGTSFYQDKDGYVIGKFYCNDLRKEVTFRVHRWIYGEPKGFLIDHKNGDILDNRIQNLRKATRSENSRNKKKHINGTTSVYKGVYRVKYKGVFTNRYNASIKLPGNKSVYLGSFKTENEAAIAYNNAAERIFGEFSRLNKV